MYHKWDRNNRILTFYKKISKNITCYNGVMVVYYAVTGYIFLFYGKLLIYILEKQASEEAAL